MSICHPAKFCKQLWRDCMLRKNLLKYVVKKPNKCNFQQWHSLQWISLLAGRSCPSPLPPCSCPQHFLPFFLRSCHIKIFVITKFHIQVVITTRKLRFFWKLRYMLKIKRLGTPHVSQRLSFKEIKPMFSGYVVILSMHRIRISFIGMYEHTRTLVSSVPAYNVPKDRYKGDKDS